MTQTVAAAQRTVVLGVRHHGPGSARSVVAELERVRPAIVLIEGPADADVLVEYAADPDLEPPVALLAYRTDAATLSSFWPFAVFSPEWQALRWSAANGVPVHFCDLPAAAVLAHREATAALPEDDTDTDEVVPADDDSLPDAEVRADPIALLADAAGYDDPERWWDDVIESRLDGSSAFEALAEAMADLRAHTPPPKGEDGAHEARREAHMRQAIRTALKQTDGTVAVICGAWHAPALIGKLPPAAGDAALLRGLPKVRSTLTWVPWTQSRLAFASGYGAGVESPGWYHHLFTAPDRTVVRWMTKVGGVLRERDLPVSSAHLIEAVRLAETLGALRGRPLAGLTEVTEATRAVLCDGDDTTLRFVHDDLVVGERLGTVPDRVPTVPLELDLRAQLRSLRLKLEALERTVALDLRKDNDRAKSVLFHRLAVLGLTWATPTDDTVRSTGTFRESWVLQWDPGQSVALIDAALWGTTVAGAAAARLLDTARSSQALAQVTRAVELALLGELDDVLPLVLDVLDERAAVDLDVVELMDAVPSLVRATRYGDVRGTEATALVGVVDAIAIRVCAGLPAAVTSLSDESAAHLRTSLDALHDALGLHARTDPAPRERWLAALGDVADRRDVHGLIAGRVLRLLVDVEVVERSEAARRFESQLSIGVPVADKAAFADGFLSGSGLVLVHDRDLLTVLDRWIVALTGEDFLDVLPLLRRAFGGYTRSERTHITDAVRHLDPGSAPRRPVTETLDPELAAGVLDTVAGILVGGRP